jgi:hypothetical protein
MSLDIELMTDKTVVDRSKKKGTDKQIDHLAIFLARLLA